MKIQIISDLHHEFGISFLNFENIDLLIVAGDLDIGIKGVEWLKQNVEQIPVIYILGNHEYYKGSYPKTLHKIIAAAQGSNIHVLENSSIEIEGITIHGATLWTNFELFGNPRIYGSMCQEKMNDYKYIRRDPSYSKLRSIDTYQIHYQSIKWLKESLTNSTTQFNIVVTHHAPSPQSLPNEYKDDFLSAAYTSDLEDIIKELQPNYWIHGHIHHPSEYMVGNTKIICNPHGYIMDKDNGYNPKYILNI